MSTCGFWYHGGGRGGPRTNPLKIPKGQLLLEILKNKVDLLYVLGLRRNSKDWDHQFHKTNQSAQYPAHLGQPALIFPLGCKSAKPPFLEANNFNQEMHTRISLTLHKTMTLSAGQETFF